MSDICLGVGPKSSKKNEETKDETSAEETKEEAFAEQLRLIDIPSLEFAFYIHKASLPSNCLPNLSPTPIMLP
jgi:hypothetical protein